MLLLLLRHGQTEADILNVHEGRADFQMTETGHQQAERMAQYISSRFDPDVVISSTMTRTKQTTEHIVKPLNTEVVYDQRLVEWNNGVLAGLTREEALKRYPMPPNGRPLTEAIEEGESELAFRHRVEEAIYEILEKYKGSKQILIVSHGGTISHLLNILLNHSITDGMIFPTADLGLHCIEIKNDKKIVHFLNYSVDRFQ
ncbi:histidine phosphatase family protein [Ureibacillus acetophenoni]|uniref:2,3-bisphosphoglycerate-dependent phosphoglycerate mutase n=1 Tax=Ureibacillus acetophenoni TaxID=614649 RepID=A0A285UE49_9BACL|nr:histidine phosphatase family protein [Ureibacillus acetophenoni]SOC40033.1 2,3-bisphosphoglycerate-dependent phosphoglycerate mutase [Ureibacillus acetophenoni]